MANAPPDIQVPAAGTVTVRVSSIPAEVFAELRQLAAEEGVGPTDSAVLRWAAVRGLQAIRADLAARSAPVQV